MSLPFSSADSLSGLSLLTSPTPNGPSALNSSNYSSALHNPLPQNEVDKTQGTCMFSMSHRTAPGSSGHFWFLQVGFKYLEDNDSKTTMLLGLSLLVDILPDAIDGFALHPLEPDSTLPALTSNKTEDGFPGSAMLALKYFLVKKKSNKGVQQTVSSLFQPSLHRHNDEKEYRPPTALWGVIWVTGDGNVKEACEALAWDMVDLGLQVHWKDHQSADSSAQVLLMNVLPVLDRGGVKNKIIWHLTKIKKGFLKKGTLPAEYVGTPLPELRVSLRQNKQGKGKSKAERDLSLNKLVGFWENGCLICMVLATTWSPLGSFPQDGAELAGIKTVMSYGCYVQQQS
jgi:hypothetical protein